MSIGEDAFSGCNSLASVTIGNSVTSIGDGAFSGCTGLTSITIPNSVTSIGGSAFCDCSSLTSVTIPNSVTSIKHNAFSGCTGLTSISVEQENPIYDSRDNCNAIIETATNELIAGCQNTAIPNSVTSIEMYAFYGCTGLTSVTIPNSVTSIEYMAFGKCTGLTSITIPNSVTRIGDYAFRYCSSLASITIPNSVTSVGTGAFQGCSSLTSVTIGNSVTIIGSYAFSDCSSLTSVTIGNSVTTIGSYAFQGCSSLLSITIPNSVTSIGNYTFQGCSSLTSVSIGNSVTSIGSSTFSGCSSLTSVTIPNSVKSIAMYAFSYCSSLTSVTIGNSVTTIGSYAFQGCSSLLSITIPNSVTSIGNYTFQGCSSLTSVSIGNSVTSIGSSTFSGCSSLTSLKVDQGNTVYDSRDNCNAIIKTATNELIVGCQNTVIPNSVTSIGDGAFSGCTGLTSVTIPNSVTSIGKYAFSYCSSLASVTCEAVNPPQLGTSVFYNVPCEKIPLYVPKNSVAAYKAAYQWNTFNPILPIGGYQETTYTVRFVDWNGTILKEESVKEGTSATAPNDPVCANHIFTGWDKDFSDVQSDMTIIAVYRPDLGPDATETNTTEVVITPIENGDVVIEWPALENATSFTIEIKKEGEIICTLTFNEKGQLISVTPAAPSRFGERMQSTDTQAAQGWKYTIMGLEADEEYTCTVTIKNGNNTTLLSQTISFTTVSVTAIEDVFRDKEAKDDVQKVVYNGQLYILRDGAIYNAAGMRVK